MVTGKEAGRRERVARWGCAALCVVVWTLCAASVQARQVVRVGLFEDQPQIFVDENGRPQGLFIDVIEHIAQQEDWQIRYVYGTWAELMARLRQRTIDILPAMYYSEDRDSEFVFSAESLLIDWGQIYVSRHSDLRTVLDLEGKRLGVVKGNVFTEPFLSMLRQFEVTCDVVRYDEHGNLFRDVERGDVDAIVVGRYAGFLKGRKRKLKAIPFIFHPTNIHYAALRGGGEPYIAAIDRYLGDMKANPDSVYHASLRKWFGYADEWRLPAWVVPSAIAAAGVLVLLFVLNVVLKRQVSLKTRELSDANRELERSNRQLRASRDEIRRLIVYQQARLEEDRRHVAREIHDELGQDLTVIKIRLAFLEKALDEPRVDLEEKVGFLQAMTDRAIDSVRSIARNLRPGHLDDLGLEAALLWHARDFAERTGIAVDMQGHADDAGLTREQKTGVYRIFQESLTNVARHARAGGVRVRLGRAGDDVHLSVLDDGAGIDAAALARTDAYGLMGMRERALAIGGTIDIRAHEHGGTLVDLHVPAAGTKDGE